MWGKLDRVPDQVDDYLLQAPLISYEIRQVSLVWKAICRLTFQYDIELNTSLGDLRSENREYVLQNTKQVKLFVRQTENSFLKLS